MVNGGRRAALRAGLPVLAAGLGGGAWSLPAAAASEAAADAAPPRLGINLNGLSDWSTELPFVDFFRLSRTWISQRQNDGWGKGPALALDDAGWVRSLEADQFAEAPMCTMQDGYYPPGTYLVLHEGKGELDFWGGARVADRAAGRLTIEVSPSRGPIWLRLKKTDPANPVRNIRVLRPGFEANTPHNAFHPDFLRRWQGMGSVRFMDWMATNNSKQTAWKNRPLTTDARFTDKGAPVEVMVDLANRLDSAPWFCMPHLADDDYVQKFATLVKDKLSPNLKVYLEFSNEVWNDQFSLGLNESRTAVESNFGLSKLKRNWSGSRPVNCEASSFHLSCTNPAVATPKVMWVESSQ